MDIIILVIFISFPSSIFLSQRLLLVNVELIVNSSSFFCFLEDKFINKIVVYEDEECIISCEMPYLLALSRDFILYS